MKKVLKVLIPILLVIAIAVGAYFLVLHNTKKKALNTIEETFTAIKAGDEEKIKGYFKTEDETEDDSEELNAEDTEMYISMLKNLNYEVVSIKTKINECDIKLKISNKDLKTVFSNYMTKAFSLAFSQAFGGITEEEMNTQMKEYFVQQYDSESTPVITSEIDVNVKKENGKWNINCDKESLVNAALPGLKEITETFNTGLSI